MMQDGILRTGRWLLRNWGEKYPATVQPCEESLPPAYALLPTGSLIPDVGDSREGVIHRGTAQDENYRTSWIAFGLSTQSTGRDLGCDKDKTHVLLVTLLP